MADYWKSNDRKFCDFCKCWIADNKPSIVFHENGKRHKEAVSKRISDISRSSAKNEREQQKMDLHLRKMEEGARLAYAEDICRNADLSTQSYNRALNAAATATTKADASIIGPSLLGVHSEDSGARTMGRAGTRQVDPVALPMDSKELAELEARRLAATRSESGEGNPNNPSLWCETVSDEGHTYYWNVKTNDTVWDKPKEGFLKLDEYNNIMEEARRKQEVHAQREKQFMVENADELAAKFNREKLKRVREENDRKEQKKEKVNQGSRDEDNIGKASQAVSGEDDGIGNESPQTSYVAGPFGKWQTVVKKEIPYVDLQLPENNRNTHVIPIAVELKPVVKTFKEKVAKLDTETVANSAGVFKKRKINITLKRNTRQRLDD